MLGAPGVGEERGLGRGVRWAAGGPCVRVWLAQRTRAVEAVRAQRNRDEAEAAGPRAKVWKQLKERMYGEAGSVLRDGMNRLWAGAVAAEEELEGPLGVWGPHDQEQMVERDLAVREPLVLLVLEAQEVQLSVLRGAVVGSVVSGQHSEVVVDGLEVLAA